MDVESAADSARQVRVRIAANEDAKGEFELRDHEGRRLHRAPLRVLRFADADELELVGVIEQAPKREPDARVPMEAFAQAQSPKVGRRLTRSEREQRDARIRAEKAAGYTFPELEARWQLERRHLARIVQRGPA